MSDTLDIAVRDLPWLRALASRLARGDVDAADDLVQEALERAWHGAPTGGELAAPRGWLATVLRNRLRMTLRAGARRSARESATHAATPSTHDPTDELARLQLLGLLVERLHALPELDRRIVMLRYFDELDATAIGERLAMAPPTVRSRLHRALAHLRDEMDAHCGDRRAWAVLLGAPVPARTTTGLVGAITAMSTATKLAIVTAVAATATAVWITRHERSSFAHAAVAPAQVRGAQALPRGLDSRTSTRARPLATALPAAAPLRASPPPSRLPVPDTGAIDEAALLAEGKAALQAAFDMCSQDLAPDGPPPTLPGATYLPGHGPMHPTYGRVVIRATMIGSPEVGAMFDSITVVEATEPGGPLVECLIQSAYAYTGPAPASDLASPVTMAWLGPPPAGLDDDTWREQMFESVMLAYVPEDVDACDPEATATGELRFELDFSEDKEPSPAAVRVDGPHIPSDVVECVRTATAARFFPPKFADRTMAYVVQLPIERSEAGEPNDP